MSSPVVPEYTKPLPAIDQFNRPFWEGTLAEELRMPRCTSCGHVYYPPGPVCTRCLADSTEWSTLSGKGEIYAVIVFHQIYNEAFRHDVPYNVVLVKLDEGPFMFSNIVDIDTAPPIVGEPVEVVFDRVTAEVAIPRFRRIRST